MAQQQMDHAIEDLTPDLARLRIAFVNVYFAGAPGGNAPWALVDAGLAMGAATILHVAAERFGVDARPAAIILTHGHFDHVGCALSLAEEFDAPVYAHALEKPYLDGSTSYPPADPSVGGGLIALISPLFPTSPIDLGGRLLPLPEDGSVPGLAGWRWLHTPGHAPGHVSLWRESDRTLLAGDAVITTRPESAYAAMRHRPELHGPPTYFTPDWKSARQSVEALSRLMPEVLLAGHGHAMRGPQMRVALQRLAREFDHLAVPKHGRYRPAPARAEDERG